MCPLLTSGIQEPNGRQSHVHYVQAQLLTEMAFMWLTVRGAHQLIKSVSWMQPVPAVGTAAAAQEMKWVWQEMLSLCGLLPGEASGPGSQFITSNWVSELLSGPKAPGGLSVSTGTNVQYWT